MGPQKVFLGPLRVMTTRMGTPAILTKSKKVFVYEIYIYNILDELTK